MRSRSSMSFGLAIVALAVAFHVGARSATAPAMRRAVRRAQPAQSRLIAFRVQKGMIQA